MEIQIPKEYEVPLHLFHQGNILKGYDFFGSHFAKKDGKDGVMFRLWAANAKSVSVVGDFNHWDRSKNPMRKISSGGIWELFIPALKKFDAYKYSVEGALGMVRLKADPYGYHMETRPGTATKIYDISGFKWTDDDWFQKQYKTDHCRSAMNVYEVHLNSWRKGAAKDKLFNYVELGKELVPYVKKMGYTHIEMMPVAEFPFDGSWGYQGIGYYAPTSRYGTPHDFMAFVDFCHKNDIGVILDWVPAHFPKDAAGLYEFDGGPSYEYADPLKQEHHNWGTRVFDWGKPEVQSFLISNAFYWLDAYHIDGLRVDAVASMLYLDYDRQGGEWRPNQHGGNGNLEAVAFFRKLNAELFKEKPHILMVAEESTSWPNVTKPVEVSHDALGFNFKWNMGWMNDTIRYMSELPEHRKYHHDKLTFSFYYAFAENFILPISHDEVVYGKCSMIDKMSGPHDKRFASLRTFEAYKIAHPGKKLTFMGQEFAQFKEWNFESGLDWDVLDFAEHAEYHRYIEDINKFYRDRRELWDIDNSADCFKWVVVDDTNNSIIVFKRMDSDGNALYVVANFGLSHIDNYRFGVELPKGQKGVYKEIFTTERIEYGGTGVENKDLRPVNEPSHGEQQSITVEIASLSAFFLEFHPDVKKPAKTAASAPAKTAASAPAKTAAAPAKTAVAPAKTAAAPAKTAVAPVKTAAAPVKTAAAPVKTGLAPVKSAVAPAKTAAAPAKTAAAPVKTGVAPAKTGAKPAAPASGKPKK
ncbi:1,4-alpha-glucan branching enzyme GlgB [Clostridia bacterium]|nr:1,4-alpha-glucan branching enzyme GlgB [Clostridia bacterium]